jgi:hypothetical protein
LTLALDSDPGNFLALFKNHLQVKKKSVVFVAE